MALRAGEDIEVSDAALDRHDSYVVGAANELVGPDDILIHCGDVAWGAKRLREYRDRLRVREVYVTVGNHDEDDDLARVFGPDRVAERFLFEIHAAGGVRRVVADHYGGDSWLGSHKGNRLVFGHSHGTSDARRAANPAYALSRDVGVDAHHYRPWSWDKGLGPLFDRAEPGWREWARGNYKPLAGKESS